MSAAKGLLTAWLGFWSAPIWAQGDGFEFYRRTQISSEDYLMGSHGPKHDRAFDRGPTLDLGLDLGIGADCGRIDF